MPPSRRRRRLDEEKNLNDFVEPNTVMDLQVVISMARCLETSLNGEVANSVAMNRVDNPAVAKISEKVVKTTFPQEHEQREVFKDYFVPLTDDNGVRYWRSDRREQYKRSPEQIWVLSIAAQPKVPIASSKDFKEWQLGSETVTAPLHVLRTRPQEVKNRFASASGALVFTFTFRKQLQKAMQSSPSRPSGRGRAFGADKC